MREYRTQSCRSHGHPEIVYWLNEAFEFDGTWLSSYFETEVARGRVFKVGETVQIGWMLVLLKSDSSGDLEVWEPEFDSMPIRWIRTANNTFRHLVLQKSVCKAASCEPSFPELRNAGLVSPGFLVASDGYLMVREQVNGNDSGWVFTELNRESNQGEFRSLFELSFHHTSIIPFLALPSGASVKHTGTTIEVVLHDVKLSSESNELIRKLLAMSVFV